MRLEFNNVCFSYGNGSEIKNMSFTAEKGEFIILAGENGAGKSTVSKLCSGLLKPDSGSVMLDSVPTNKIKISKMAGKTGFLFQNPDRQICCNTVFDEVMFTMRSAELFSEETAKKKAESIIAKFGLDSLAKPYNLSRGERQILALASVLVTEPEMLILDEPTTGLDYKECMLIMNTVKELNDRGTTVIAVSHDMEIVSDFASRIIVISGGRIIADGSCKEIFGNTLVTAKASLLPPQITDLAMRTGMIGVTTVDEAFEYLKERAV